MSIESNIKKWVMLDNNYKKLYEELKNVRTEKNKLSNNIINYFNDNEIKKPIINISDGRLSIINTKQLDTNISLQFLNNCFKEYFDNDNEIIDQLLEFIKNKRKYSINTSIKRTYKVND
tara:strand:- start:217 stop:573 length:357 start_codon:yes stop_codon:yes gene_type:complete